MELRNGKKTKRMEVVGRRKAVLEGGGAPSLSVLPESLLIHIVSFLPDLIDVISLAPVSKQWEHLWTMVPNLAFSGKHINVTHEEHVNKQIRFVDKALALRRSPKIDRLSLFLDRQMAAHHVDRWVGHAMRSNVDDLELHSSGNEFPELPEKIYTAFSSLKKLSLTRLSVDPIGLKNSWDALTTLSIDRIKLSNQELDKLLEGCPVLEFLKLREVWGFSFLELDSKNRSLKKLVLDRFDEAGGGRLTIFAPFLKSLTIRNCRKLPSLYVWSLVDAWVDFDVPCCKHGNSGHDIMHHKMIMAFLHSLSHAEKLMIHTNKVMSILEVVRFNFSMVNCKILTLQTGKLKWGVRALANLSQGVPNLETLVMKITKAPNPSEICDFDKGTALKDSDSSLDHLKLVKIHITAHQLNELDLDLVQFILKNAKALEKMVFYKQSCFRGDRASRRCCNSRKLLQGVEKLRSLPRSSPNAVIMVA